MFTTHSELRQVLFLAMSLTFLFVYEISLEPLNGFGPTSQRRGVWSLAWTSFNVMPNSHGRGVWSLTRMSLKVEVNFGRLCAVYVRKNIFAVVLIVHGGTNTRSLSDVRQNHAIFLLVGVTIYLSV